MNPKRSRSTHPDGSDPNPEQPSMAARVGWPIALILSGLVLTLGWTAFLAWVLYATVLWTIS